MIKLTSLQGEEFFLNTDLIERVEELPDTIITLTSGKKMRVVEDANTIVEKFINYKRKIQCLAEVQNE